jgi:hypothetical protein
MAHWDEVIGHDCVYGELLIGDIGGRKTLLASYERMDLPGIKGGHWSCRASLRSLRIRQAL